MIILPDRNIPRARFLMPVKASEWREPSRAMFKDQFGNPGVRTRFRLRARLNDGHVAWTGWFNDREDADAFLCALVSGSLRYERELWRLPTPEWHPVLGENLKYDFATQTIISAPTGSLQTGYTVPSDWNDGNNKIEVIGGGASGGACAVVAGNYRAATGGGGGGYGYSTNVALTIASTPQYQIAAQVSGVSRSTSNVGGGNNGNSTWFNGGTYDAAATGATGGSGGTAVNVGSNSSTQGGNGGSGKGTGSEVGGDGGDCSGNLGTRQASGGGGAGGPNGAGNNGVNVTTGTASAGGSGDAGSGGAGGTAADGSTPGGAGGDGTEWSTAGSGGGGGGARNTASVTAGAGGQYGGGGGGATTNSGTATSGVGRQGVIVITYTPASQAISLANINLPMMGM